MLHEYVNSARLTSFLSFLTVIKGSVLFPVRLNLHTPSLLSPLPLNTLVETNDPRRTIMDLFSHLKLVNLDVAILSVISIWVASIWSLTRKRVTSKNPKLPGE